MPFLLAQIQPELLLEYLQNFTYHSIQPGDSLQSQSLCTFGFKVVNTYIKMYEYMRNDASYITWGILQLNKSKSKTISIYISKPAFLHFVNYFFIYTLQKILLYFGVHEMIKLSLDYQRPHPIQYFSPKVKCKSCSYQGKNRTYYSLVIS